MSNVTRNIYANRSLHILCCVSLAIVGIFSAGSSFGNSGRWLGQTAPTVKPQSDKPKQTNSESKKKEEEPPRELMEWEKFKPDFEDHDLDGTENRAWEYRPYKVAVWFCLDGSPILDANYRSLAYDVTKRSELMDASGWDLTTGLAPPKYRDRFLRFLETPERCISFEQVATLEAFDKLMIVCLQMENGRVKSRVREFDIQTQQWGPINRRVFRSIANVGNGVANSIAVSFMPLVKIDRIDEIEYENEEGARRLKDEVVMQVRAVKSCQQTVLVETALLPEDLLQKYRGDDKDEDEKDAKENDQEDPSQEQADADPESDDDDDGTVPSNVDDGRFTLIAESSQQAPAFINARDRFLPIIRRTDKKGNLVKLEPIEFTYLTINSMGNAVIRAAIHSAARAPLSQRRSKRAQKLALVIRPPANPTTLLLTARDEVTPMEGFEIYSRRPGQSISEKSEFIGKTDWKGEVDVPPSKDGLRLIYIKRGARALKKLPIIPGLYARVESTLPNDETRLYAEGVFNGLENEVLGLVIRRQVAEEDVAAAIKSKNVDRARAELEKLNQIEKYTDMRTRLSNAASDLRFRANDTRERTYIDNRNEVLEGIIAEQMSKSKEEMLTNQVLEMSEKQRQSKKN